MKKLCCIGLPLATRLISTYTMSLSILMINLLMSNYFSRGTDNDFFDCVDDWGVFGLNWMQILRNLQVKKKAQTAAVFLLVYTISFLLASASLALGSISRKPKCAVPWMYLQMISIIDQTVALSIHLTHEPQYNVYDKSMWYIPVSTVYLLLSTYLWIVVQAARREWAIQQQDCTDEPLTEVATVTQPNNSNGPKSPSFLAQNFSMFESPRPPTVLPK
ncbi:PREDICTED: uncharacterized protein LOC108555721 [Eufriesea mexicana]|uniref:uncharacterized protein LOC108555721 n=1 Tax=Eufriesea mexicana TaxID=516756 RepID=UPI00083C1E45|nr:PREDICTED: uncharacterized protein LOC108555721 [Eufriesea mexicana]